jgi:phenylpropionate dioxygenase-like ring-hydroxylating dioxygenase large terminal subunit
MFQSDTHLPHLLKPSAYYEPEQFKAEMQNLMWPAWHCVASTADFPKLGSRRSLDLLGFRLLLERTPDGVRGAVTHDPDRKWRFAGRSPQTRVEVSGSLVFVSFTDDGPSLLEYLSPHAEYTSSLFSSQWQRVLLVPQVLATNWKALVENILESYHLETVHTKTFRTFPPADVCFHELESHWSSYVERNDSEHSHLKDRADTVSRLLCVQPHPEYRHVIIYPHFVIARMGLFSWAQTIVPISPRKTLNLWQFFLLRGTRCTPRAMVAAYLLRRWARHFFTTALEEDGAVLAGVQAGLEAASHPSGGLISAREERIFHFQRYVVEHTHAVSALATTSNS